MEYRPLEGFVAAISPFNFTAIGSNLSCAPAQMGNVVLWKPSHTAILSNYYIFEVLREAGLPDGVIQFLPSQGAVFGATTFSSPHFTALHFTGGTKTFQGLYRTIATNIDKYKTIPRIVAETGGKNFHVILFHIFSNLD
jgi:1-pyrroline-5-carboxylate dehydrogenase